MSSTRALAATTAALALLALASTRIGHAQFDFRYSLLVLLAGAVVGVLGLWTWRAVPASLLGPLLLACAIAWFLPGLRYVAWPPLAAAAAAVPLLWAAVLGHAVLAWPDGRARSIDVVLAVAALYAASLAPVAEPSVLVGAVLAAGLALTAIRRDAADRRAHAPALAAGLLLAAALAVRPLLPAVSIAGALLDTRPLDQLAVMACAGILAAALQRRTVAAERLTDLVVELGRAPGGVLSRQLGAVLGDPTLRISFRVPGGAGYVDPSGRPTEPPSPGSGRAVEHLAAETGPVAILAHDPGITIDPAVLAAIGRGASLWTANAALQAELRAQVAELRLP